MTFLNTPLIRKLTLFLAAVMLSLSAMATDFNQVQRLANQGDADAQHNLGWLYQEGEGVRQDYAKAKEWYEKAANQGYADAQYNLGQLYRKGEGVRQNDTKAFEWFEKSANQGNSYAQYSLGRMYYKGEAVRENTSLAKEWFGKSCDNGNQNGCDIYRMLNEQGY